VTTTQDEAQRFHAWLRWLLAQGVGAAEMARIIGLSSVRYLEAVLLVNPNMLPRRRSRVLLEEEITRWGYNYAFTPTAAVEEVGDSVPSVDRPTDVDIFIPDQRRGQAGDVCISLAKRVVRTRRAVVTVPELFTELVQMWQIPTERFTEVRASSKYRRGLMVLQALEGQGYVTSLSAGSWEYTLEGWLALCALAFGEERVAEVMAELLERLEDRAVRDTVRAWAEPLRRAYDRRSAVGEIS